MEAIREIRLLKDKKITIELPESFINTQVEIVVLKISANELTGKHDTGRRRTPADLLKDTKITGDIMTSPVNDQDWDVLS